MGALDFALKLFYVVTLTLTFNSQPCVNINNSPVDIGKEVN